MSLSPGGLHNGANSSILKNFFFLNSECAVPSKLQKFSEALSFFGGRSGSALI
jgi:hypothetical protein